MYLSQRGIYLDGASGNESERNLWKYSPLNTTTLNPLNPTSVYLFSEIRRGVNGKLYLPNMDATADAIHSYDGINMNTIPTDINYSPYHFASALPTQVYKLFGEEVVAAAGREIGKKQYELKDHLGNVRVVIADVKLHTNGNNMGNDLDMIDENDYFSPHVLSFNDYYPFGSLLPGRNYSSADYRYGFQGQEKDDEVAGHGNSYTSPFWQYDARIGKRWNLDPVVKPYYSGYAVLGNNPIINVDKNGDDWFLYSKVGIFGIKYGWKLKWVDNDAVIYDGGKHHYVYLGKSLNLNSVGLLLRKKWKDPLLVESMMLPLYGYYAYYENNKDKGLHEGYSGYGSYVSSSNLPGVHKTVTSDYGTNMSSIFVVNDDVTVKSFYSVVMKSFLYGSGPENFYFGENSLVSKSLEGSKIVEKTIEMYEKNDTDPTTLKLQNEQYVYVDISETELPGMISRADKEGTIATPEHLIGSAEVKIEVSEDKKYYIITIWNTTSLGSGTIGAQRVQRPNSSDAQPLTNVSQTYVVIVPINQKSEN